MIGPIDFHGKVALVTGAASGLGRETALILAEAGANLAIIDVNQAELAETEALILGKGRRVVAAHLDLTDPANCAAAVAETLAGLGRLDALCNVAGVITFAHLADVTPAIWARTIGVNLTAPFFMIQAAMPHLIEAQGAVVNVASAAAFLGEAYLAPYTASKAGLVNLTKSLAMEFARTPVRINAVAPGGMATGMSAAIAGAGFAETMDMSLIERFTGLRGSVEVADVARLVAFLASDHARGYHGACLSIDNGITAG